MNPAALLAEWTDQCRRKGCGYCQDQATVAGRETRNLVLPFTQRAADIVGVVDSAGRLQDDVFAALLADRPVRQHKCRAMPAGGGHRSSPRLDPDPSQEVDEEVAGFRPGANVQSAVEQHSPHVGAVGRKHRPRHRPGPRLPVRVAPTKEDAPALPVVVATLSQYLEATAHENRRLFVVARVRPEKTRLSHSKARREVRSRVGRRSVVAALHDLQSRLSFLRRLVAGHAAVLSVSGTATRTRGGLTVSASVSRL